MASKGQGRLQGAQAGVASRVAYTTTVKYLLAAIYENSCLVIPAAHCLSVITSHPVSFIPASSCCIFLWPWWRRPFGRFCWTAPCRRECVSRQLPLGTCADSRGTGRSPDWEPRVEEGGGVHLQQVKESIMMVYWVGDRCVKITV